MDKFEIIFIIALIALQVYVFIQVFRKIRRFKDFFPASNIQITKLQVSEEEEVEILEGKGKSANFDEIINSTNDYLIKNKGSAADFNILKDISERHLEKFDSEIGNLINVPLYIGLGGTFIGIIIGLFGIDFTSQQGAVTITAQSISQLLHGIITAMSASLAGLVFTVVNSVYYKFAAFKNETDKNSYYDLLQRELLPALNTGVAKSLSTLNVVLNEFIRKFGENMGDYVDSGQLLNENLGKQQLILEEINKLSLTRTATTIADTFVKLNESSDHLAKFIDYQRGLNTYLDKSEAVTQEMKSIIEQFKDFNRNLQAISNITLSSIELQKQFKDSLETHFPTISDHREVWREQIDELNHDVKSVYSELYEYFHAQTEQIKNLSKEDSIFLVSIGEIRNSIKIFVENSNAQKSEFESLKQEMIGLRKDLKTSQNAYLETSIAILEALKEMKKDSFVQSLNPTDGKSTKSKER